MESRGFHDRRAQGWRFGACGGHGQGRGRRLGVPHRRVGKRAGQRARRSAAQGAEPEVSWAAGRQSSRLQGAHPGWRGRHRGDDSCAGRIGQGTQAMDDRRLLEQHHRGVAGGAARLVRIRASLALVNKELTSTRASARQAIPDELRRDVRMLGERLGRVIKDYGGASLLKDVETLRRSVIPAPVADEYEMKTQMIVAGWLLERAGQEGDWVPCYLLPRELPA